VLSTLFIYLLRRADVVFKIKQRIKAGEYIKLEPIERRLKRKEEPKESRLDLIIKELADRI
jgi:hypothetical protein